MKFFKRAILASTLPLAALLLSACSGDSPFAPATAPGGDGATDTDGNINAVRIGSDVNGSFSDGVAQVSPATISASGNSVVTVSLVDASATASTSSVTVAFSSQCVTDGTATFSNPTFLSTTGTATTNYTANGCVGSDLITATINGTTAAASGTVTIAAASVGSLQLSNVSESLIALSGTGSSTGLPENSTITFIVRDGLGLPVQGEVVNFSLNNAAGSIALSSSTATSNGAGEVITTVQSGSVATSVRVTATLASNPLLITTSSAISIATGPPDQDSFSLSVTQLNPRAWNFNGTIVPVTVYLADRFNNPITDGTAISFTTELGAIDASCTTINGSCSVNWRSQSPRTNNLASSPGLSGISTLQATVEGEESFLDVDSNGKFSDGDSFTDLAEAFRDDNANGQYDAGEFFSDFNSNGVHDPANGLYNGKGCAHSTLCDNVVDAVTISQSIEIVLAEDTTTISAIYYDNVLQVSPPPTFKTKDYSSISFTIGGSTNGRVLPVGSKVSFSTTNGKIISGANYDVLNVVASALSYTVLIDADDTPSNDGSIIPKVDISDGGGSITFLPIAIDDTPTTYIISVSVEGLAGGETLYLKNNGSDNLTITADGTYNFIEGVPDGQGYEITAEVKAPAGVTCTPIFGSGTVKGANVTDVIINCI